MSTNDEQQVGEKKREPTLSLDFAYNLGKSGDVILRADDGSGFYASLPLLAELSSFFRKPPKDLSAEEHEGTEVIPLQGTSRYGLMSFVEAVASLLDAGRYQSFRVDEAILEAAVCAKVYDVPAVFRILIDGVSDDWTKFAIAAIGDVEEDMQLFAKRLLSFDLLSVPQTTIQLLECHAYHNWERFKDLVMRHHLAIGRFCNELRAHADWLAAVEDDLCNNCGFREGSNQCKALLHIEDRTVVANLWGEVGSDVCACRPVGGKGLHNIVHRHLEYSEVTLRKDPSL